MAEILLDPPLDLDLGENGGEIKFDALNQIETFVNAEQAAWNPFFTLIGQLQRNGLAGVHDLTLPQRKALSDLVNVVGQVRQGTGASRNPAPILSALSPFANRAAIHSKSTIGRMILDATNRNDKRALGLYMSAANRDFLAQANSGPFPLGWVILGAIKAELHEAGLDPALEPERQRLQEFIGEAELAARASRESLAKFQTDSSTELTAAAKVRESFAADVKEALEKSDSGFSQANKTHEAELEKIRASFREEMNLRAPREYWAAKRLRHRTSSTVWAVTFGIFCAVSIAAAVLAGIYAANLMAKNDAGGFRAADWILLGVPTLIALWVLRFIHRQATAHLALMADADERVTMVETYLALQTEGKIDQIERPLVLQPLFRPVGVTGDDGVTKSIVDHVVDMLTKK
jgi:Family of unknown function (DUF6161)